VDLFQGQLKSRLKCPINGRVSNQFDPFMYLSVPIPVKTTRKIIVTFYPIDLQIPPTRYGFSVDKSATVWDLKVIMGHQLKIPPQSLFIFDVFNSRFHREFKSHDDVNDIRENDVVAVYEVTSTVLDIPPHKRPKTSEDQHLSKKRIFVLSREEEYGYRTNMGNPFVISVDLKVTFRQLYTLLHAYLLARNHIQPTPDGTDVFKVAPINSTWSNYYGVTKSFQDNDMPLDLDDKESVACEFNRDNRRKYFNDRIDEKVVLDQTSAIVNETGGKDQISLTECLRLFTTEEQLSANDAWYCTECKEFREAYKKFDIWSAPKLLVFQLKRFSAVNRVWRERLDNLIDFPVDNLDLSEFVIGPKQHPAIYDLYAVSNHFGGMGGGHYTAYARHRDDNNWYRYDDSSVSPASVNEIVSRAAYVLFYKRRDIPWGLFDLSLDKKKPQQDSDDSDSDSDDSEMEVENSNNANNNNENREQYAPVGAGNPGQPQN